MIVGHGDVASAIPAELDRPDRLYFASGVSHSAETRDSEYQREKNLLWQQPRDMHLIYFSSLSIFYANTRYTRHKRQMEQLVKYLFQAHTIVRLGNITWGTNPHTLLNHLRARHLAGQPLDVQDTYRFVVSRDEFLYWMGLLPSWPCEFNIPGRRLKVADIVQEYVFYPRLSELWEQALR